MKYTEVKVNWASIQWTLYTQVSTFKTPKICFKLISYQNKRDNKVAKSHKKSLTKLGLILFLHFRIMEFYFRTKMNRLL